MRSSIIDKIVQRGGNSTTGHFPGRYVDVASELNLSSAVVSKIWKQFCETNSLSPLKNGGGNKSGLSEGVLQLIEVVKRHKPSTTYAELADILLEVGDIPRGGTSKTALSNAVRHSVTRFGNFYYQIRLDALRQPPLIYILQCLEQEGMVRPNVSICSNKIYINGHTGSTSNAKPRKFFL